MKGLSVSALIGLVLCLGVVYSQVPDAERQALVDFYTSTQGQNWGNTNWLTGDPCLNNWVGVQCGDNNQHVGSLVRQFQNLNGTLPDSLGDLSKLEEIFLSFSPLLVGTFPSSITQIETLSSVTLESLGFTGSIPSGLGSMAALNELWLSGNFTGSIPDDLFGVAPYQDLTIIGEFLTGNFPSHSFCKSPATMTSFTLQFTGVTGSIPDCWDNFPKMTAITMSENFLTGTVPSSLAKLPNLEQLVLYNNSLTGTLPELSSNTLYSVYLQSNKLSGSIPDWSQNFVAGDAGAMYLGTNSLTGTIPNWICGLGTAHMPHNNFDCPNPSCCSSNNNYECGMCNNNNNDDDILSLRPIGNN